MCACVRVCMCMCVQGDSGFVVVRQGQVVARSKPLQHYFDCPLQLGAYPEFVEATDTADMADLYSIPLLPGDVVVAGGWRRFRPVPPALWWQRGGRVAHRCSCACFC